MSQLIGLFNTRVAIERFQALRSRQAAAVVPAEAS